MMRKKTPNPSSFMNGAPSRGARWLLWGATLVAMPWACAEGTPSDPRIGQTECGDSLGDPVLCEAGYHCADPTFNACELGCTSDKNCVANQRCVKPPQQAIGTCDANDGSGGGPASCDAEPGFTRCIGAPTQSDPSVMENCCQPGQYCEDPMFERCTPGCLSDENCAADQTCVKASQQSVGTCEAIGTAPCDAEPGFTGCMGICCQPGQFCMNPSLQFCAVGCLSEENCAADQACDLSTGSPGFCVE